MAAPWIAGFVALIRLREAQSVAQRGLRKLGLAPRRRDGRAHSMPRTIPKVIWLYWDKGEAGAPALVRACIDSWRVQNPGWDVRVLDADTAPSVVDLPVSPADVPVQSYADLLRLRLLAAHGGVWADGTVWCAAPLDHWLPLVAQRGFFAFQWTDADTWMIWPNVRRRVTNWFLAAEPGNRVIREWDAQALAYWADGRRKPHVYYWPHMLFEYLGLTHRGFRRAMAEVPEIGCYGPHLVHDHVEHGGNAAAIRALLEDGAAPVQKLRWNWPAEKLARAAEVIPALVAAESGAQQASPDTRRAQTASF